MVASKLERTPIIAAVDGAKFAAALESPAEVIFLLDANIASVKMQIDRGAEVGKSIFVHLDLAEGIGKDAAGVKWLKAMGVDGIISTKASIIKAAKGEGLVTVQRFFLLDTKGVNAIGTLLEGTNPDFIELMPGVIPKAIKRFADCGYAVIAGGLIEQKAEVLAALSAGALAVSTGKKELWSI